MRRLAGLPVFGGYGDDFAAHDGDPAAPANLRQLRGLSGDDDADAVLNEEQEAPAFAKRDRQGFGGNVPSDRLSDVGGAFGGFEADERVALELDVGLGDGESRGARREEQDCKLFHTRKDAGEVPTSFRGEE